MKNIKEDQILKRLNHSCAHLLAHAVKKIYPDSLFWVGPVIEEGFYYDIDLKGKSVNENDLFAIEKEMKKIAKSNKKIVRLELTKKEALEIFKNDFYKTELINSFDENEIISAYKQEDFIDLCKGPHVEYTKDLKYFKLLKVSGAYYKGDSKNQVLQRIYGVCFQTEEELQDYLNLLEERKKRDHRKLGKELKIFEIIPEAGQGLAFWLPNGMAIKKVLEDYSYDIQKKAGYQFVSTPIVGTKWLYETSGHWDHYRDNMFPPMITSDNETLVLRPMSCPHHCLLFKNDLRSYRDLPIRYSENVIQHRWEASGALIGLERVRSMNLTDAHLFIRPEQMKEEIIDAYKLVNKVIKDLGIEIDYVELALHDPKNKEKYHDDEKLWKTAEETIKNILIESKIDFKEAIGEAAFYGPKIDIQVKTVIGTLITFATIQLDFLLPEKFDLSYIDKDGSKKRPVMIHRGLMSTFERLMSVLLEQYAGAFPLWLSPNQVNIIPVNNEYHLEYANKILEILKNNNIRVELDDRDEKLGYKMRESQTSKNPYNIIIGDSEVNSSSISYRKYQSNETKNISINDFILMLKKEINDKK